MRPADGSVALRYLRNLYAKLGVHSRVEAVDAPALWACRTVRAPLSWLKSSGSWEAASSGRVSDSVCG
jgi:hypothetical protein